MSTLFNSAFLVATVSGSDYNEKGSFVDGVVSTRSVRGSIQSLNSKDSLAFEMGSRDTGKVKAYSTERLNVRERGKSQGDYITYAGRIYQLFVEMPYLNGIIPHYKYFAELCPPDEVSNGVPSALGVA